MTLQSSIKALQERLDLALQSVATSAEVEELRLGYLGKKGSISALMVHLRDLSSEEKPLAGKWINDLKEYAEKKLSELLLQLFEQEEHARLLTEKIDITLPGRKTALGCKAPILAMLDRVNQVITEMGFSIQYGPDIETDYYNFESLNYPPDHPARDMQDTFYLSPELLLRTHTTGIQMRMMEKLTSPIRIACPGTVYRNEEVTSRSHVFFHQLDILYIDEDVVFGDLLVTFDQFFEKLFGFPVQIRVRPSYFPFVEPGMEVDMSCLLCSGSGCSVCKKTGWLEVAGAGMVHPKVLQGGGIDSEKYSGFAWGMGIERLVMIERQISDIRLFPENDLRFLRQFS